MKRNKHRTPWVNVVGLIFTLTAIVYFVLDTASRDGGMPESQLVFTIITVVILAILAGLNGYFIIMYYLEDMT